LKGYLWIINEGGLVSKFYFDKEKSIVRSVKLSSKDYEKGFIISAYVLRASRGGGRIGKFGCVKENIVYFMKDSKILVLVADTPLANSPYVYGFLKELALKIHKVIDGYALLHIVEKIVKKQLFNIPTPLKPVLSIEKDITEFF